MKAFMNDPNNKKDLEDNKKKISKNKRLLYSVHSGNVTKIDIKRMTGNNNKSNNKGDENNRRNNTNSK